MNVEKAKETAAKAALKLVDEGMVLGIGTGSTVAPFIAHLIPLVRQGLKIEAVATSRASAALAQKGGIPIVSPDKIRRIDLTIDGADEVDPYKRMIKGGGGALLREKIIATKSDRLVIIVDETKCVDFLGRHPLPVEVVPYGWQWTQERLAAMGYPASPRFSEEGALYVTDNGNHILDLSLDHPLANPSDVERQLISVVGVVETGLFYDLAERVIVGHGDGSVRTFT